MTITEERLKQVVGATLLGGVAINMLMCLNLYRQMGDLEYKLNQLDSTLYTAISSVSRDVSDLKNANK